MSKTRRQPFGQFAEMVIASTPTGWLDPQSTRIDIAQLEKRFFSSLEGKYVPWHKPSPSLPIDDFIETLRMRSRPPKLRSKADLRNIKHDCPYFVTRIFVLMAVAHAESVSSTATIQLRDANKACKALAKVQRELERLISELDHKNYYLRGVTEILQNCAKSTNDTKAEINESIRDLPDARGKPDVWKVQFVLILGFAWHTLTGRDPSPPGPGKIGFVRFVEAAYESVDPTREESWDSQIRTALALIKRRPPNDRWNRAEFLGRPQPITKIAEKSGVAPRFASILDANFATHSFFQNPNSAKLKCIHMCPWSIFQGFENQVRVRAQ